MKEQLINYILSQKNINLNIINSLVDDSTFSNIENIYWDGDTTNLTQAKLVVSEDGIDTDFFPVNIYNINEFTFSSEEELKNKAALLKQREGENEMIVGTYCESSDMFPIVYDLNNSKNFGVNNTFCSFFNIQEPGNFLLREKRDDGIEIDIIIFFEKKGLYFSKIENESGTTYPFLIIDRI